MARCRACNLEIKRAEEKRRKQGIKGESIRARNRAYYQENKRLIRQKQLAYYRENAPKIRTWNREYSARTRAAKRALAIEVFGSYENYIRATKTEWAEAKRAKVVAA